MRNDAVVTGATLAALLAWDASGLDLAAARLFGAAGGFAWRDSPWAASVLHDGGRLAAWLLLATLVVAALRPAAPGGPTPAERGRWLAVTLTAVLAIPALKRISLTSCPWELAEFGGIAQYVSHWQWGVADGGPGHCFPSGHAVSAFAFLTMYFLWRPHDRRHARVWLAAVLCAGLLFGGAQLARGAHYPSHTLWTAWLCWTLGVAAFHAFAWRARTVETAPA